MAAKQLDTQQIEIIGRNLLISELLLAGLEVALPIRDRGIDLIAYSDRDIENALFNAKPIQVKAASEKSFAVNAKYEKTRGLIIAYVWNVRDSRNSEIYALTHKESLKVAEQLNWTKSPSWLDKGWYTTSRPSKRLQELLADFRMDSEKWRRKIGR